MGKIFIIIKIMKTKIKDSILKLLLVSALLTFGKS